MPTTYRETQPRIDINISTQTQMLLRAWKQLGRLHPHVLSCGACSHTECEILCETLSYTTVSLILATNLNLHTVSKLLDNIYLWNPIWTPQKAPIINIVILLYNVSPLTKWTNQVNCMRIILWCHIKSQAISMCLVLLCIRFI